MVGVPCVRPGFRNLVCFPQFKTQLAAHRMQVKRDQSQSSKEMKALQHDKLLHPTSTHNNQGELMFSRSKAKDLLREDIAKKRHVKLTPSELWLTRPEYQHFSGNVFKFRIYQEVRRVKFNNLLNIKREEKKNKARIAKEKARAANRKEAQEDD